MGKSLPAAVSTTEEVILTALVEDESGRPRPDFKIFTKGMEVVRSEDTEDDGLRRIRCIASSSVKDLHGDVMTQHCIRSMAKQAEGLTIFRNHSYRVPEDVFGKVEKSRTKKVSAAEARKNGWVEESASSNEDVVLLQLDIAVSAGKEIDDTMQHIANGVTLGISIGANITDYEEAEGDGNSWWPPLIINDVDLLEASIVGIPANPLSWIEGATKGLITKGALPGVTETTFKRAQKAARTSAETDGWEDPKVTKKAKDDEAKDLKDDLDKVEEEIEAGKDPEVDEDDQPKPLGELTEGADGPEKIVAHYQMQIEQGLGSKTDLDSMEDAIQHSIDYALANGVDKDAFDGRTAADLAKEVLDTMPVEEAGDPAPAGAPEGDQEAPDEESEDPESDDAGAENEDETEEEARKRAADELKALTNSGVLKTMGETVQALEGALTQMHLLRAERDALDLEKNVLTAKLATAENDVKEAVALVNRVLSLPVGRKAVFRREAQEGLSKLKGGPYGDDVLSILYPSEGVAE